MGGSDELPDAEITLCIRSGGSWSPCAPSAVVWLRMASPNNIYGLGSLRQVWDGWGLEQDQQCTWELQTRGRNMHLNGLNKREKIEHRFYEKVCTASIPYITKVANMIRSLAFIEDISARESGSLPPCTIEHDRVAVRLDSRGVKLSFKRTIPRQKRATSPNSIVEADVSDNSISEMASVSVTEEYINEILYDLTESGN
ncbi:unnamed protein product, partial [Haemonchus placei]|uniref:BHLH domain-containing protein n=1 Tax=Haemonchus placei TaxID=6290 RepID=A0A0N4VY72_HAEPC